MFRSVFLAAGLAMNAVAIATPSVIGLGDLPGGGFDSSAFDVNANGTTVVGSSMSSNLSGYDAFRWTRDSGMVGLDYPASGDFLASDGLGISGDGLVITGMSRMREDDNAPMRFEAFRWTVGEGMIGLGHLPGGSNASYGYRVSGDGSVIVGSSDSSNGREAFRWTASTGMVGLGDFAGGAFDSSSVDVSGDGRVIVGYGTHEHGTEAFRWTADGGMQALGDLPGGLLMSGANGVSTDGAVVVGMSVSAAGTEAFRWTEQDGMIGLGDLPGGPFNSRAYGVSADGSVVVGVGNITLLPNSDSDAFYWTASDGMQRLWDVLLAAGVDPAESGWAQLSHAYAVSDDGKTIVGVGMRGANTEAFIAVIPEPASGLIMLAGLTICSTRRREAVST